MAEINAPRLARRPNEKAAGTDDEPWAWESREFLRQLLVGKPIIATVSYQVPSGREYGHVLIGSTDPEKAENVSVKLVAEGLAKVRDNCNDAALNEAQEAAKSAGKGVWSTEPPTAHVRKIVWENDTPRTVTIKSHVQDDFSKYVLILRAPVYLSGPEILFAKY